ncbi:ABC transporter permease [Plantactinospora endophytica]|uniref:Exporter of polyketide antibiotics n=1 Tax=Plantactinospora endophytica TaxID=673535 RepID=A0ABQ4DWD5_9ACTN|nr:anibiotic ABC transporter [Plantactinospora endophytica]GIG86768.1 exporter of polyketide antibiotics [Plantactinospora endophytica]
MTTFTGTARLTRLALRRDRVKLLVWALAVPGVAALVAQSVAGIYGTEQDRIGYATTSAASVVARAFNGPVSGPSLGSVVTAEAYTMLALLAALLSTFAVVRHTRQNEETGRAELLGSAVVGRHAPLSAALLTTLAANVLSGLLLAGVLIAGELPVAGSLALGAAIAGIGISFAAVAAVTAQISGTARGANGMAAAVVGLAFLLRAAGDAWGDVTVDGMRVVSAWPSWLSPLGWANQVQAFDGNRWWVLALTAGFAALAVGTAFALTSHRDLGSGLLAVRRGPATAPRALLSPVGLAWRLQRGVVLGWAVGVAVMGLSMGSVGDEVGSFVGDNEAASELIAQLGGTDELVDAFLGTMMAMFALAVAGFAVQSVLRLRAEETAGTLEGLLATALSRPRWLLSHLCWAALGTAGLLALAGASTGLGYGLVSGDVPGEVARLTVAGLVQVPAVLALAGLVVVLFGLLPRLAVALSWSVFLLCVLVGQLGALLELPQAVLNLSPFTHLPAVPATDPTATPLVALLVVAVALTGLGLATFRRRDLAIG